MKQEAMKGRDRESAVLDERGEKKRPKSAAEHSPRDEKMKNVYSEAAEKRRRRRENKREENNQEGGGQEEG